MRRIKSCSWREVWNLRKMGWEVRMVKGWRNREEPNFGERICMSIAICSSFFYVWTHKLSSLESLIEYIIIYICLYSTCCGMDGRI